MKTTKILFATVLAMLLVDGQVALGQSSPWTQNGDKVYVTDLNANVGIGTNFPVVKFAMNGDAAVFGGIFTHSFTKGPNDTVLQVRSTESAFLDISVGTDATSARKLIFISAPAFGYVGLLSTATGGASALPLTFGMQAVGEVMRLDTNGNVGIGTTTPTRKLSVKGEIEAEEIIVVPNVVAIPDFVFEDDYALRSLEEVERYIDAHGRLPEIPSAEQPRLKLIEVQPWREREVCGLLCTPVPMDHAVPAVGYRVADSGGGSLFYTGDTAGGVAKVWSDLNADLLIVETTFPNAQAGFAELTRHMTPASLERELANISASGLDLPRVIVVHMNTRAEEEIVAELRLVAERTGASITPAYEGMLVEV